MKKMILLVSALAFASLAWAQETAPVAAPAAAPAKTKKAKVMTATVMGTVSSVDLISNSLVIKTKKGEEKTVTVDSTTAIKEGKKKLALGDVQSGASVTAVATEKEGKWMASKVTVKAAMAEKKAAAPATEAK